MGTSKKHKEKDRDREHKRKRKHRSRSRSKDRERSEKHSKRREKRRKPDVEEDNDIEYMGTTSIAAPESNPIVNRPSASESYDIGASSGGGDSLSVEESNRLRAKLGLKPLDVGAATSAGQEDGSTSKQNEDIHAPAVNWAEQRRTESLREKMAVMREKRLINKKLGKVKTLGDSDSDDDGVLGWVKKSRKLEKEKKKAEKTAKMLEEMDEDFGIGNLIEEEFKPKKHNYSSKDLKGLTVHHDAGRFQEGKSVILTLKDRGILDEEGDGDELINVNMLDDEFVDRNLENKKKKPDYKPYDEPEYDEYGTFKPKAILEKYDEEIEGRKEESFRIGSGGRYDGQHEKQMSQIRAELKKHEQSLSLEAPQLANEYFTNEEMEAKFKKVKKKLRKIRKLKADDILPLPDDDVNLGQRETGNHIPGLTLVERPMEVEADNEEDLSQVKVEDDEVENELHLALTKARKLKLKKDKEKGTSESIAAMVHKITVKTESSVKLESNITLNSTSEFCRNLGEIPTYGLAGNREEERDETMDLELEIMEQKRREEEEDNPSGWNEVDIDDQPADIMGEEISVLEEEPIVSEGVGAALQLAMKKGYLEKEMIKVTGGSKKVELESKNYSIEDKRYDDLDEKFRKRDRYTGGAISEFKDKDGYKPNVKLEYVDDKGRNLDPKEAFRQLSHRFHGKGSGKKKTEKRNKKIEEEQLMKMMSSTDTPLNTLSMLKDKQRSEKSPYIILSGNKGMTAGHSIMKSH